MSYDIIAADDIGLSTDIDRFLPHLAMTRSIAGPRGKNARRCVLFRNISHKTTKCYPTYHSQFLTVEIYTHCLYTRDFLNFLFSFWLWMTLNIFKVTKMWY